MRVKPRGMSLLARSRPRLRDEAPGRRRWRPSAPPTSRRQQSDLETRVCRQTSLIVITAYRCAGGNQLCQKFSISLLALSSHAIRDLETFVTLRSELPEAGARRPRHASQTQHQRMTTPHSRTYGIYGGTPTRHLKLERVQYGLLYIPALVSPAKFGWLATTALSLPTQSRNRAPV